MNSLAERRLVRSTPLGVGESRSVELSLGRHRLRIDRTDEGGGLLRLVAEDGGQLLEIEVRSSGPVLRFSGPLAINVDGAAVSIDADTISLHARRALDLVSDGSLTLRAGSELRSVARAQDIRATLGDVRVSANDDVVVDGERIKLNCS